MNGKGSKQRPTNYEAFSSNYDSIFGYVEDVKMWVHDCKDQGRVAFYKGESCEYCKLEEKDYS
jgi:uncharacterized OB-fold protein